jgi:signal transduction histidine kinase
VKYSSTANEVSIKLFEKNEKVTLQISNRGAVISAEERKKIFDNFYRITSADPDEAAGCGLGLAIAKKIVDLHDGAISFQSQNGVNVIEVSF